MSFGLERQLCSARGVNEVMTSQWSNLRAPFHNHACVKNFSLSQATRHNVQWPGNNAHTCTDHNGNNNVRWKFDFLTQTFCKWYDCHFIERENESPHMKHLENRALGIWCELFQSKMRLFSKDCDQDENQSPTFSVNSTCGTGWKWGWNNDALLLLTQITNFCWEHCGALAWPPESTVSTVVI